MTASPLGLNPKRIVPFSVLFITVLPTCQKHCRYEGINVWLYSPTLIFALSFTASESYSKVVSWKLLIINSKSPILQEKLRSLNC